MKQILATICMTLLLATGCGNDDGVSKELRDKFVEADAQRLCAIQKETYTSAEEMNTAYEKSLETAGITGVDKDRLLDKRETDKKLREDIAERFQTLCPA